MFVFPKLVSYLYCKSSVFLIYFMKMEMFNAAQYSFGPYFNNFQTVNFSLTSVENRAKIQILVNILKSKSRNNMCMNKLCNNFQQSVLLEDLEFENLIAAVRVQLLGRSMVGGVSVVVSHFPLPEQIICLDCCRISPSKIWSQG